MAKFSILNPRSRGKSAPNTVNFEGGRAFTQTAKLELISVLLTTFLEDEFYRTEKQTTEKIRELITKVGDPRFVAKAALCAQHLRCGFREPSRRRRTREVRQRRALDQKLLRPGRAPSGRRYGDGSVITPPSTVVPCRTPSKGSRCGAGSVTVVKAAHDHVRKLRDSGMYRKK